MVSPYQTYMSFVRRLSAAMLLCALLLPKLTGVLAGIAGLEQAVICTGGQVETVIFDRDGQPVQIEVKSHDCILSDSPDHWIAAQSERPSSLSADIAFAIQPNPSLNSQILSGLSPARAPPAWIAHI